jgi:hypothetical protein
MRKRSHGFWLCIAAAAAVSVIAVPAAFAVHKYDTKLSIDSYVDRLGHQYILGGMRTPFKCRAGHHRQVTVFEQRPGANRTLGAKRSSVEGLWGLRLPEGTLHRGGRVYARVRRQLRTDSGGNTFVCRAARSQTLTWREA